MPKLGVVQIVRPNFDRATSYSHYYMGLAAQYAAEQVAVRDLAASKATKSNILTALDQDDPVFCYWNGHGTATTFTVQNKEIFMQTCTGDEVLIGRVLLLLSCSCGISLAPDAVSKGATTVFAWTVDFTWFGSSPVEPDPYSLGFFESVNAISNALADGKTTGKAMNLSLASWNEWIDYWASNTDPYASEIILWMIYDRDGQKLFGSPSARITAPEPVKGGLGLLLLLWLILKG